MYSVPYFRWTSRQRSSSFLDCKKYTRNLIFVLLKFCRLSLPKVPAFLVRPKSVSFTLLKSGAKTEFKKEKISIDHNFSTTISHLKRSQALRHDELNYADA